ncbi:MAG: hypothetical protein CMJ18_10850 [Phycisphaeraceae bacterium]|nr:hypothetical protein [Phycisphaeraceae bacterium]
MSGITGMRWRVREIFHEQVGSGRWLRRFRSSAFFVATLTALVLAAGCGSEAAVPSPQSEIRFGLALQPSSALAIIAIEQDFFRDEGIVPEVETYVSGKRALGGLLDGNADVVTCAQAPLVFALFERHDLQVICSVGSATDVDRVVARRDAGIEQPADLRGKRIATQRASAVHFFLHLFLARNGIPERDVRLSYFDAERLADALVAGEIDAFSMREPYVSQARSMLADNVVVFSEPGLFTRSDLVVVRGELVRERPEIVVRMIRALLRAERFARAQSDEALKMVSGSLGVSESSMDLSWSRLRRHVGLEQSLLTSMEDQARWAIDSGLVVAHDVPNYLDMFYLEGLNRVRPDAMTIIH